MKGSRTSNINLPGRFAVLGRYSTFLLGICLVTSCLDPYSPKLDVGEVDILVVNGFLDSSDSSASVRLTKTLTLGGDTSRRMVQNANVTIESDDGSSADLSEESPGQYVVDQFPVDVSKQYRVHIFSEDEEYVSDFATVKQTPQIDSVTWRPTPDATKIYVNTHDDTNNTRYYKWDFIETYEYDAGVVSQFKIVNRVPVPRQSDEYLFTCWRSISSNKIYVNSTIQLQKDVVRDFALTSIPIGSIKLSKKYSVLVKQRALSENEFLFFDQLQKTTESIGGLFDPQPSELEGNVHNITGGKDALGYFSVGNTTSMRLFIRAQDLPEYMRIVDRPYCQIDTICVVPYAFLCIKNVDELEGDEMLAAALYSRTDLLGYTFTTPVCADCRASGGVLQRPSFWK